MKFSATLLTVAAFVGLPVVLADAQIKNLNVASNLVVKDSYIVTYKKNADPAKKKKHQEDLNKRAKKNKKNGVVNNLEFDSYSGYVANVGQEDLDAILKSDLVDFVEKDTIVTIQGVAAPVDEQLTAREELAKRAYVTQTRAAWGLGRISRKAQGSAEYYYDNSAGKGVRVYVLDTGIRIAHEEFAGRAVWGRNFIAGSPNTDEQGHGTHVAGTIAGKTYGVAKAATVVAVKILDKNGSGTMSGIVAGLNWVVSDARARGILRKTVVNMSVGGPYTASVNAAVKAATDLGLTIAVAAGNDNDYASYYSPASAPSALTIAATDGTDSRAWFSNYGSVVDIFAPGVSILSAGHTANNAYKYLSGTSMACPHVAGLAAYFIAKEGLSGSAVANRIISASIKNQVGDAAGSQNRLAYNANGR
ncbi:Peptidase S8/S53 domain containing protein [Naviculisporaceae sp. PSN 640]